MLMQLRNIQLAYGHRRLLDGVDLTVQPGERIALVGRNGSGKSSLMRIISGELQADDGERQLNDTTVVARLEQEVPPDLQGEVFDVVAAGLGEAGALLSRYHHLAMELADQGPRAGLEQALATAQQAVDTAQAWNLNQQVEAVLDRLDLPSSRQFASLSGGQKRRVLLARALVRQPDILLLDEPTNHLDIQTIAQLEQQLLEYSGSLIFITHDRAFLRRLATRIVDLDRGRLSSWPGDYAAYLDGKAKALADEEAANQRFDSKLAEEEAWIRQGIKARRTRNQGRVRALQRLRQERAGRVAKTGQVQMSLQQVDRSGRRVIVAEDLAYAWQEQAIVCGLSCVIQRGDKIGIVGPNGAGKTTLLRLLLGQLAPDSGTVTLGTGLQIAHFEQHREGLDEAASVADNVADGHDYVTIDGKPRHVISYLQEFLFAPERARTPVRVLSGGERNRLLLARILARPANLLVMDEPTNDLDVETLELLEARLVEYAGTLLLVSHDREFLDNVVTSTLVLEGGGHVSEYVGGYSDYLRQRPASPKPRAKPEKPKPAARPPRPPPALSQKERRELQNLPSRIEKLEAALEQAQAVFADPTFYQQDEQRQQSAHDRLQECEQRLEEVMRRWEELEDKAQG